MSTARSSIALCAAALALACGHAKPTSEQPAAEPAPRPSKSEEPTLDERARALARRFVIVDGHVDLPWRLYRGKDAEGNVTEDVNVRTEKGDFDLVRAREGGLDAPFMSIYVPSAYEEKGGSKELADELIDLVEAVAARSEGRAEIARSPDDVRRLFGEGKIALPLGLENGSPIEGKLENLRHFYARGVRYVTLAHAKDNHLADSSYDDRRTHKGLSPFGREVVAEMNRLGMLVDISHLSDDAARQAIELSQTPVIASHSSCRHFTPGWERNISDELIALVAKKGGVVMINFGSTFIDQEARQQSDAASAELDRRLAEAGIARDDPRAGPFIHEYWSAYESKLADVTVVADHIDHVVKLVGVDYAGLGSDFDGVGDTLPVGLKDASEYPNLFRVLLERGYSEEDIEKIAGKNALRVWDAAVRHAQKP